MWILSTCLSLQFLLYTFAHLETKGKVRLFVFKPNSAKEMASDLLPVTTSLPCQLPSKPIDIRQMLTFFSIWQDALLATNLVFCLAEKTPSHHLEITFILLSPHPYKYPRLSVSVLSFCGNQRHDTSSKIYFFHWVLVFLSFFLVLLISSNMYSVSTSSFPWALRYTHVSLMLKKKGLSDPTSLPASATSPLL